MTSLPPSVPAPTPDSKGPAFRVRVQSDAGFGSGLVIARKWVLTCEHVLVGADAYHFSHQRARVDKRGVGRYTVGSEERQLAAAVFLADSDRALSGTWIATASGGDVEPAAPDLALIELDTPLKLESARLLVAFGDAWERLSDSSSPELTLRGFARGEPSPSRVTCRPPSKRARVLELDDRVEEWSQPEFAIEGFSGGPITIRLAGVERVVGVIRAGGENAQGMAAIGAGPALDFLRKHLPADVFASVIDPDALLELLESEARDSSRASSKRLRKAGVVLVCAAVLALAYLANRPNSTTSADESRLLSTQQGESQTPSDTESAPKKSAESNDPKPQAHTGAPVQWERTTEGSFLAEGLTWRRHPTKGTYGDQRSALREAALATSLDWRLPDTNELEALARLVSALRENGPPDLPRVALPSTGDRVWSSATAGHSLAQALRFTDGAPQIVPTMMGEQHFFWFVRAE